MLQQAAELPFNKKKSRVTIGGYYDTVVQHTQFQVLSLEIIDLYLDYYNKSVPTKISNVE